MAARTNSKESPKVERAVSRRTGNLTTMSLADNVALVGVFQGQSATGNAGQLSYVHSKYEEMIRIRDTAKGQVMEDLTDANCNPQDRKRSQSSQSKQASRSLLGGVAQFTCDGSNIAGTSSCGWPVGDDWEVYPRSNWRAAFEAKIRASESLACAHNFRYSSTCCNTATHYAEEVQFDGGAGSVYRCDSRM